MRVSGIIVAIALVSVSVWGEAPYFATGIKVGEVTDSEARVWVRLTKDAKRVDFGAPLPIVRYRDTQTGELVERASGRNWPNPEVSYPDGTTIDTIEGAAPGRSGRVRVYYRVEDAVFWQSTEWQDVVDASDYTTQFELTGLKPDTRYNLRVVGTPPNGDEIKGRAVLGGFRTAPVEDTITPVTFTVSTGQRYTDLDSEDGYKIYDQMARLDPNFFVHTGDIVYYDVLGKSPALARWHWQRTYSLNSARRFHNNISSYFIKDDHDTLVNDCWPTMNSPFMGEMTFKKGLEIFREQVPMGEKTYRTVRWGKDLQIWMVEGRDFRSPNTMKDGPEKTIWGKEQMDWFKRTVQESDATFRVLISPTPVVGPDRTKKKDNHANAGFTYEGNLLREFIASQKNMIVICGDRHWQYVSVDAEHGVKEFSCGPASDEHAGGWKNDMLRPEHKYLNVIGGFLAVTVERDGDVPVLVGRHHGVDGKVLNEDRITAE
ncbi:MAG: alkaline phosphatase D family protein [Candidatus Hydrogenedentota bacterium]